ncbi:MAG TPA: hypothetical protein VFZ65_14980 [Planctomycetota bacterium]|nr:hypothetical protein [Planctomycetota bacterium]
MRCGSCLAIAAMPWLGAAVAAQSAPLALFRNFNQTFQIELPSNWRQVAPNEALTIAEHAAAPAELRRASPRLFYAVGPVDDWLAGRFDSAWLHVVEQDNEWVLDDDFAARLAEMWQQQGAATGSRNEVGDIERTTVGAQEHPVVTAVRRTWPKAPGRATKSLDVYAPTGGRQLTLSFTCWDEDYAHWEPEFRRWLRTFTCARKPRGEPALADRLWTPLLTGAIVAVVLWLVHKHLRRR